MFGDEPRTRYITRPGKSWVSVLSLRKMPAVQKIKSTFKTALSGLRGSKRESSDGVGLASLARLPVEILLHIGYEVGILIRFTSDEILIAMTRFYGTPNRHC